MKDREGGNGELMDFGRDCHTTTQIFHTASTLPGALGVCVAPAHRTKGIVH